MMVLDSPERMAVAAVPPWRAMLPAFALTFAAAMFALPLRVGGLTVFWPAAGVVAGLLLVAPGRRRGAVFAGSAAALALASFLGGRSADMVAVFVAANLVQGLAFTLLLERTAGRPFRLDRLPAVTGFVVLSVALPALVAWALSAGLLATGRVAGPLAEVWFTVFSAHAIGILTVAPAVLAVGGGAGALGASMRERLRSLALLAAFSAGALLLIGLAPANDDRALIAVFALLYPFALWLASRTSPAWCALALVALALAVIGCTVAGVGLFAGQVPVAQLFLVVGATWMLTLGLVLERKRVALRRAVASEAALRDSLRAGGAFSFDWCARTDEVVRDGQQDILGAPARTTGRAFFEHLHPQDRPDFEATAFGLSPAEPTYLVIYRYRRDDGRTLWLEERGRGEFDAGGRLTRLQGITVDVTARKQAEAALREADRRKDEFIATLAHELRNPLAPIRTGLEVLGLARDDLPARERAVAVMKRQVGHIVRLVDDLLDVSRLATGKLVLRREPVALATLLADAVEDVTPLARSLGHRIDLDLDTGPLVVDGDRARLMQVAVNLLNNALRYTPPGGRITLRLAREGEEAVLRVIDSGIGIPADKLETVFDLFVQVHGERGFQSEGLGIGLHLTRRLVLLHGGSITAASAGEMQGSAFTVRLPLPVPPAGAATPADPAAACGGLRVLIVDDLADSADTLAMLLAMHGHNALAVHSGEAALARLDDFAPQVALVDIGMPGVSGLDVARAIRARRPLGAPLLVAVSGWGREEDRRRSLDAGFDVHLAKPLDVDELNALMAGAAVPA